MDKLYLICGIPKSFTPPSLGVPRRMSYPVFPELIHTAHSKQEVIDYIKAHPDRRDEYIVLPAFKFMLDDGKDKRQ